MISIYWKPITKYACICTSLLFLAHNLAAQEILSLEQVINNALNYDQIVKATKNQTEANLAIEKATKTFMMPSIDLGGAYNYNLNPARLILPTTSVELTLQFQNTGNANVNVSQPIYMGGKLRQQYELSKIETQIAQLNEIIAVKDVKMLASFNYWIVVSNKELLNQARANERLYDRLVEDLTNKFNEGLVNKNDLLMSQVQLSQAQYNTIVAENNYRLSVMELNKIMGVSLTEQTEVIDTVAFDDEEIVETNIEQRALQNREELKTIAADITIAEGEEKLIKGDYLPQVSANWNTAYAYPGDLRVVQSDGSPSTADPSFLNNVNVGVNIPVVRFNQKRHRLNAQKIVKRNLSLELEAVEDQITLSAQQSYYNYTEAFKKVKIAAYALAQAEENLRLTKENYDEGIIPILDLIEAQKSWQESYKDYITSKALLQTNKVLFLRAIGEI